MRSVPSVPKAEIRFHLLVEAAAIRHGLFPVAEKSSRSSWITSYQAEIGEPSEVAPNCGRINVQVEMSACASPEFEVHPSACPRSKDRKQ